MFQRHEPKSRQGGPRFPQDLIVTSTPASLLSDSRRHALIQKMASSSALDATRFNTLCLGLLHNVTNYYQQLPESTNRFYTQAGGLIDRALNRTEAAIALFRHNLVPGSGLAALSEDQQLWLYALFTAGLLKGIGKLQLDYHVELFDATRIPKGSWNPLLGSLASAATYYRYTLKQNNDDDLKRRLNLLLAYQLMPAAGFSWIASNEKVLAAWLELLHEDPHAIGPLAAILERADAIAITRDLNEFLALHANSDSARPTRISTFIDRPAETGIEKEQLAGAEFIKWLTEALAKGQILLNTPPVLVIPAGLMLLPEAFQLFIRENPEYKNWQAVQKGFLRWGLHKSDASGQALLRAEDPTTQQMINALTIDKYSVLLADEVHLHHMQSDKEKIMSATEFMTWQQFPNNPPPQYHLSATGEWLAQEVPISTSQPGFMRNE